MARPFFIGRFFVGCLSTGWRVSVLFLSQALTVVLSFLVSPLCPHCLPLCRPSLSVFPHVFDHVLDRFLVLFCDKRSAEKNQDAGCACHNPHLATHNPHRGAGDARTLSGQCISALFVPIAKVGKRAVSKEHGANNGECRRLHRTNKHNKGVQNPVGYLSKRGGLTIEK